MYPLFGSLARNVKHHLLVSGNYLVSLQCMGVQGRRHGGGGGGGGGEFKRRKGLTLQRGNIHRHKNARIVGTYHG